MQCNQCLFNKYLLNWKKKKERVKSIEKEDEGWLKIIEFGNYITWNLCQSDSGSGVENGKAVVRDRTITKDLEKQDSNHFYSLKTFGNKEKKIWGARLKNFWGKIKFVFSLLKERLSQDLVNYKLQDKRK